MKKRPDIEKLKPETFSFGKEAFTSKTVSCNKCQEKLESKMIEIELEEGLYARLQGFECPKCGYRLLSLGGARKLDRLMVLSRLSKSGFKIERSLSFDGDNYTLRIPKEFTYELRDKKIDIIPLSKKEFYSRVR